MPIIPLHISALFIALVFGIAFLIIISVQVCGRRLYLPFEERRKNMASSFAVIFVWLTYTLIMGLSGYLADFTFMPPKILLVTLPPLLFILILFLSKGFHRLHQQFDNFWFIYPQSFRILMEFILWLLYRYKVIPVQMTFEGINFDILVGVTAPIVAYYCFNKKSWSPKVAVVWNIAGLILLGNIVVVAILSSPYPFRAFANDPANTIVFYFPFVWLPSVVVPFALLLHLISLRRLLLKNSIGILRIDT
ncbi:MAG: hypothetical protein JWO06_73 [Bacteroidota bacterium]|nr:hypothetical protein [Bacteroidota bacterium]